MSEMVRKHLSLKTIITILVTGFFIWLIYKNLDDFETIYNTVERADFFYLLAALILGIANFKIYSHVFQNSFKIISIDTEYPKLLSKTIIYHFLSVSNPLGSAGGSAYLIQYVVSRGLSHIKAVFGILVTNLSFNIAYLAILIFTLYSLNTADTLQRYQWYGAFLIFALILGLIIAIAFFLILPKFEGKIARAFALIVNKLLNPILKRHLISDETLTRYTEEARSLSHQFDKSLYKFIKTLPISLLFHTVNMLILFISFQIFDIPIEFTKIMTLYGVITLFTIVAPTPQGIGIVEGLAHTAAISVGIGSSGALLAILVYRLAIIWFPALLGFLIFKVHRD